MTDWCCHGRQAAATSARPARCFTLGFLSAGLRALSADGFVCGGARASRLQRLQPSLATSSAEALVRRQLGGSASVTSRMLRQMRFRRRSPSSPSRGPTPLPAPPDFKLRHHRNNNNNLAEEGTATSGRAIGFPREFRGGNFLARGRQANRIDVL